MRMAIHDVEPDAGKAEPLLEPARAPAPGAVPHAGDDDAA